MRSFPSTSTSPPAVIDAIAAHCDVVVEALADRGSCTSCSLQDILELDRRGLPGVGAFSAEFRTAVAAWQSLHGFEAGAVFVRHPIQPLDDDEVRARADEVFESILDAIADEAGGRDT